jgi:hypothetical protein
MTTWPRAASLLAIALLLPARVLAQPSEPRVAVWGAIGVDQSVSGTVTTTYVPELKFSRAEQGSAGQVVTLGPDRLLVGSFGADVFFTRNLGVEASLARGHSSPVSPSTPYETSLRYVSRPPPDYAPVVVEDEQSTPWTPVQTSLDRWTTSLNGVVRWGGRGLVGGTLSGGLSWVRTTASFEPLGYTMFVLGGHSTLFANEYTLATEMVPTTEVRGNVGGTIDLRLGRHAGLVLAVRQVLGPETHSTIRVTAVDRSQAGFEPPQLEDITAQIAASRVSISTASFELTTGIKVYF